MPRYIDADYLVDHCKSIIANEWNNRVAPISWAKAYADFIDDIEDAPTAEVKYGEWVYGEFDIPHCSECGEEAMPNNISKYCPNCGAKMDGEE